MSPQKKTNILFLVPSPIGISPGQRFRFEHFLPYLKEKGIDVEYMVKDDEGHGFRNQNNRFDFYGAMEKFLEKHLKNKK